MGSAPSSEGGNEDLNKQLDADLGAWESLLHLQSACADDEASPKADGVGTGAASTAVAGTGLATGAEGEGEGEGGTAEEAAVAPTPEELQRSNDLATAAAARHLHSLANTVAPLVPQAMPLIALSPDSIRVVNAGGKPVRTLTVRRLLDAVHDSHGAVVRAFHDRVHPDGDLHIALAEPHGRPDVLAPLQTYAKAIDALRTHVAAARLHAQVRGAVAMHWYDHSHSDGVVLVSSLAQEARHARVAAVQAVLGVAMASPAGPSTDFWDTEIHASRTLSDLANTPAEARSVAAGPSTASHAGLEALVSNALFVDVSARMAAYALGHFGLAELRAMVATEDEARERGQRRSCLHGTTHECSAWAAKTTQCLQMLRTTAERGIAAADRVADSAAADPAVRASAYAVHVASCRSDLEWYHAALGAVCDTITCANDHMRTLGGAQTMAGPLSTLAALADAPTIPLAAFGPGTEYDVKAAAKEVCDTYSALAGGALAIEPDAALIKTIKPHAFDVAATNAEKTASHAQRVFAVLARSPIFSAPALDGARARGGGGARDEEEEEEGGESSSDSGHGEGGGGGGGGGGTAVAEAVAAAADAPVTPLMPDAPTTCLVCGTGDGCGCKDAPEVAVEARVAVAVTTGDAGAEGGMDDEFDCVTA